MTWWFGTNILFSLESEHIHFITHPLNPVGDQFNIYELSIKFLLSFPNIALNSSIDWFNVWPEASNFNLFPKKTWETNFCKKARRMGKVWFTMQMSIPMQKHTISMVKLCSPQNNISKMLNSKKSHLKILQKPSSISLKLKTQNFKILNIPIYSNKAKHYTFQVT